MNHRAGALNLYEIRHGQTKYNEENKTVGGRSNDLPLDDLGSLQAVTLGKQLLKAGIWPDVVRTSPARRAQDTARLALSVMGCTLEPIIDPNLQEQSQGLWEGRSRADTIHRPKNLLKFAVHSYNAKAPYGESMQDLFVRGKRDLDTVVDEYYDPTESVTIFNFSHGNLIRAKAGYLKRWPPLKIYLDTKLTPNTSVTPLQYDGMNWRVEAVGMTELPDAIAA